MVASLFQARATTEGTNVTLYKTCGTDELSAVQLHIGQLSAANVTLHVSMLVRKSPVPRILRGSPPALGLRLRFNLICGPDDRDTDDLTKILDGDLGKNDLYHNLLCPWVGTDFFCD